VRRGENVGEKYGEQEQRMRGREQQKQDRMERMG
jgi:hypothetical protein